MSVSDFARERGITRVLHYTSQRGMHGSVMTGALLSRQRVEDADEVSFVFEGIWERRDLEWVDHISLSLSRINLDLLQRSRNNFPDYWWAVMEFDVTILDEPGVVFTTTNNVYPPCERAQGEQGFEAMFGPAVEWGYYGSVRHRRAGMPDSWPTDRAAEVLFPGQIGLEALQAVHVESKQIRRLINAWADAYGRPELPVQVNSEPFAA